MSQPLSDRGLLARIARSAGGKARYKQLIRELGLCGGRDRRLLLEQLAKLVAAGELRQLEDELWAIPAPNAQAGSPVSGGPRFPSQPGKTSSPAASTARSGRDHLVSGQLDLHRDGFGFVRSAPHPGRPISPGMNGEDIFIPPNSIHGAMHGDIVLVDEDAPGRDGRRSGQIARVLTRRNQTVVGIFHYGRPGRRDLRSKDKDSTLFEPSGNFVHPWDERVGGPIEIPPGAEIVPQANTSHHRTLGAEAAPQGARTLSHEGANDERWPLEGLAVEVEITSFPQPGRPATGRVIEVLGASDAFGVDVEIIIRKHAIPHTFPAHTLAEAEARSKQTVDTLPLDDLGHREDFRGLSVVTIDGETARDFDDAVHVRPLPHGHSELQVHIADVSAYVEPGSALDIEARVRGTSVYFPDRAVPMLPHALSSGICSLLPGEDRLVLSCVMEIDAEGEIVRYRLAEGIIRSARRMTYTSVQSCLNASPHAAQWNGDGAVAVTPEASAEDRLERERIALEQPELAAAFERMLELALRLNRKRVRRGSIDFDLPEPVVEFDPDGNMKAIVRSERGWSHRLIEEFMLSANECVATWLTAQGIPSLFRIHEMPDPKRIVDFEETAAAFGQTLGIGALPVKRFTMKTDRRESQRRSARGKDSRPAQTRDLPERIPVTPQMYQRLVRRIAGKPEERILSYLMLRSLKQARYAEKNEGHFALASPCYTHFTSPIRRYPDLIVHRLLRTMLHRGADPQGGPVLSTDSQPWKAELDRQQGRHATVTHETKAPLRSAQTRSPQHAREVESAQSGETSRSGERRGRVGWSLDAEDRSVPIQPALTEPPPRTVRREEQGHAPVSAEELTDIAVESSQAERRAADAERELIEWKKMKFMADRVGDNFTGIILSVTKFGFFVELDELFIEGLVPLGSLPGDFYSFRDADRAICGARTGHCFRVGDHVQVLLDRIDRQQRRLQFALLPGTEPKVEAGSLRKRRAKVEAKNVDSETKPPGKRKGKAKKVKRRG